MRHPPTSQACGGSTQWRIRNVLRIYFLFWVRITQLKIVLKLKWWHVSVWLVWSTWDSQYLRVRRSACFTWLWSCKNWVSSSKLKIHLLMERAQYSRTGNFTRNFYQLFKSCKAIFRFVIWPKLVNLCYSNICRSCFSSRFIHSMRAVWIKAWWATQTSYAWCGRGLSLKPTFRMLNVLTN